MSVTSGRSSPGSAYALRDLLGAGRSGPTGSDSTRPVFLDGATGTELQRLGIDTSPPLWSARALADQPDAVRGIHERYLAAGAEIVTTNTFRTNVRAFTAAGRTDYRELTKVACGLARAACRRSGRRAFVAGSVAPVEDCYEPWRAPSDAELIEEHRVLVGALAEGGVDFVFAETMNSVRETAAVLEAARDVGLPVAVSFVTGEPGALLSGEPLADACRATEPYEPLFVGVNCRAASDLSESAAAISRLTSSPVAVYANGMGSPGGPSGWTFGDVGDEAEAYLAHATSWVSAGVRIVGGCCGTTPEYIEKLVRHFRSL